MRRSHPSSVGDKRALALLGLAIAIAPASALAGEPEATSASSTETEANAKAELAPERVAVEGQANSESSAEASPDEQGSRWDRRRDRPWLKRWAPERNMVELGVYGGALLLAERHELFEVDLEAPDQGYRPLRALNPDFGARAGYYPLRVLGLELEGGAMPSRLDDGTGVVPFTVRGQLVAQLGLWSVTPFVLVGGGMLGVRSPRSALGNDIDPALHFGGGLKVYINRWVMLRLDLRDVVSHKQGPELTFVSHNLEALLGLSVTLGRSNDPEQRDEPPPVLGPKDRDADGILDRDDHCPDDPETINDFEDEDGCPEMDADGDGFWDKQDACPSEPGVDPDGCPIRDSDGDGIFDDVDQCIDEPETDNGFEDSDGCPDELPEELVRFTGSIKGITFDTNKATIRRTSLATLDEAVRILGQYPDIKIEIAGHTDSRGGREHNLELSQARAESVANYLSGMGVDEARITTVGYGPDVPVDTNDTREGRANNRRIEFRILTGAEARGQDPSPVEADAADAADAAGESS